MKWLIPMCFSCRIEYYFGPAIIPDGKLVMEVLSATTLNCRCFFIQKTFQLGNLKHALVEVKCFILPEINPKLHCRILPLIEIITPTIQNDEFCVFLSAFPSHVLIFLLAEVNCL
jgi:hypothetical protein